MVASSPLFFNLVVVFYDMTKQLNGWLIVMLRNTLIVFLFFEVDSSISIAFALVDRVPTFVDEHHASGTDFFKLN